ncbi:hypothetical protein SAMN06295998_104210 [Primorskyibacter flagellatus]|uniref:Stringent starvation protein B n=2 Tax=Primorskyibacter flagellatus TaxID=1387277 RepID=A0A1W2BPN4_9RHOB|nr:hypothetical protein SAMN06295998_104210 [Primorskyibacter flagellatus]
MLSANLQGKRHMSGSIDYGNLMHRAMRGLIKEVLTDVAADGLPGEHHFFITFDTGHPDVQIADWLSDRYPGEMTVVMQHWYDNLKVGDEGFGVSLNFGDAPEALFIPYDAIKTFVDPSVEFGLRFENQDSDEDEDDAHGPEIVRDEGLPSEASSKASKKDAPKDAEVVSLDSFRK